MTNDNFDITKAIRSMNFNHDTEIPVEPFDPAKEEARMKASTAAGMSVVEQAAEVRRMMSMHCFGWNADIHGGTLTAGIIFSPSYEAAEQTIFSELDAKYNLSELTTVTCSNVFGKKTIKEITNAISLKVFMLDATRPFHIIGEHDSLL